MYKDNFKKLIEIPITIYNLREILELLPNNVCIKYVLFCAKQMYESDIYIYCYNYRYSRECSIYNAMYSLYVQERVYDSGASYVADAVHDMIRLIRNNYGCNMAEAYQQDALLYLRKLIIDELPEDMKDNWLLVASL